jgi:copper oxidase (laccase) domain-containing protein
MANKKGQTNQERLMKMIKASAGFEHRPTQTHGNKLKKLQDKQVKRDMEDRR